MADFRTRLIIVSNFIKLKSLISTHFQDKHNLEIIFSVYSISQLSQMCVKNRKNIVILDITEQPSLEPYLKSLSQKYNVLIISINTLLLRKVNEPYKVFMKRPDLTNQISCKSFLHEVELKIEQYIKRTPEPSLKNFSNTVSEHDTIIAIASSTGGTEALLPILQHINTDCPPILIVQHMPMGFTKLYADRLEKICPITITEAKDGDYLQRSTVMIAPGDLHMRLAKKAGKLCVECFHSEKINGVRPAADILFKSVAQIMGKKAIGVILTGMGNDGAKGLYEMHQKGSYVIGQDEKTCIVYGMPKVAFDIGAVDKQLPINKIAEHLNYILDREAKTL